MGKTKKAKERKEEIVEISVEIILLDLI